MKKKKVQKQQRKTRHEIVVRVQSGPVMPTTPTADEIAQPMHEGKQLAIPKTWVSEKQIMKMVQRTPKEHVYQRPGKGGETFHYVTGNYVEKVLNYVFGFLWDFEIVQHGREDNFVWVHGKLTVKDSKGNSITKSQFGRAEVKHKRNSKEMLDFGNDLKAAATDSLKKCASLLGIASDIYGKTEYTQETGRKPREEVQQDVPQIEAPKEEVFKEEAELLCHGAHKYGCGNPLTKQEHDYSKKLYGKPLCRNCQKESPRKK